ncbi:hypothetical protein NC651_007458 [Populus alba x Populus x berolinensis]|nr:hypothetical protein NC651_007458 [Populus alba x Populus x berolinensis]
MCVSNKNTVLVKGVFGLVTKMIGVLLLGSFYFLSSPSDWNTEELFCCPLFYRKWIVLLKERLAAGPFRQNSLRTCTVQRNTPHCNNVAMYCS